MGLFRQFGWGELLVVLLIAMVLFGAKRLPEIGKSLGRGIREFKTGVKDLGGDVREGLEPDEKPSGRPSDN